MGASRASIAGSLALLAASTLFALALGEATVRALRPQFVVEASPANPAFWRRDYGFYRHDPDLGWSHVPGAEGVFSRPEFSHRVRINGSGWRDRDRAADKPPGTRRLVVLGDSFAWGHGVEDEQVFTRRLEALLPGVEALNMALSGSSTDQQLLILQRRALAFHPDLVIVMVCRNDYAAILSDRDGPYPKPRYTLDDDGALRLTNVPVPDVARLARLHDWARRHSALWNLAESSLEQRQQQTSAGSRERRRASYDLMRAILRAMRDAAARGGASFAIGIVPSNAHTYPVEIPPLEAERTEALERIGAEEGIAVIDLVPAFRAAARDPGTGRRIDLHYRRDLHWNALGHEVAAAELARQIGLRGLLGAAGPS